MAKVTDQIKFMYENFLFVKSICALWQHTLFYWTASAWEGSHYRNDRHPNCTLSHWHSRNEATDFGERNFLKLQRKMRWKHPDTFFSTVQFSPGQGCSISFAILFTNLANWLALISRCNKFVPGSSRFVDMWRSF